MRTVYYSDDLNKSFETEEECLQAEKENEEKLALVKVEKEERKQAAEEVKKAFEAANDAYKEAQKKMNDFVEKYGSFHLTLHDAAPVANLWEDFFAPFHFWF